MGESAEFYTLLIEGQEKELKCSKQHTLLQSLTDGQIFLEANCGGRGTCGKCKVQVLVGRVTAKNGLAISPGEDNTYQACQVYPQGDVTVRLKQSKVSAKGQITEMFVDDDRSLLSKIVITPEYPTVANHYSLQDMISRVLPASAADPGSCADSSSIKDEKVLHQLATVLDASPELLTVTLFNNEVIVVEAGNTADVLFGVAFDIGTTTVVGMLVDINQKKVVAIHSETNPQTAFGADVISRIQAANELPDGLVAQSQAIRQCLNRIVKELCAVSGVSPSNIYAATIAGNSTMSHLLLEISPSALVRKPFAAVFKHITPFYSGKIELGIHPAGKVVILPNIASFIGSDTTAAVLAVDQDISAKPILMVDLGTNGEMVLGKGNTLYACSTAAGPAFEGAHIRDGMRATAGAIADVTITDNVLVEVIGNSKPAGICGSGIVKAVAELVKAGIIGPTGRFDQSATKTLSANLGQRLKKQENQWEYVLVEGKDSANGADISVTQADIRQIQLVKSSICTGIQFLLEQIRIEQEIQVCLAGAFGNYIDIDSTL
ncbi:MAG TPA: ASKHA domain-containing protein, partial [Negativicutes bacterium]